MRHFIFNFQNLDKRWKVFMHFYLQKSLQCITVLMNFVKIIILLHKKKKLAQCIIFVYIILYKNNCCGIFYYIFKNFDPVDNWVSNQQY